MAWPSRSPDLTQLDFILWHAGSERFYKIEVQTRIKLPRVYIYIYIHICSRLQTYVSTEQGYEMKTVAGIQIFNFSRAYHKMFQ
jgi:hypothetical protein